MRVAVAMLAALGLAACGDAPSVSRGRGEPLPPGCNVYVTFGSYSAGPDGQLIGAYRGYWKSVPADVASTRVVPWKRGIEGEFDICIRTTSKAATGRVFAGMLALSPSASRRGWTKVRADDGRAFEVGWSR